MAIKTIYNRLLDTPNFFIKDSLAEFKTDVINVIETHTERPVSLGDRESCYEDFDEEGKTKDKG